MVLLIERGCLKIHLTQATARPAIFQTRSEPGDQENNMPGEFETMGHLGMSHFFFLWCLWYNL
jgi:hypothetical protein